MTAEGPALREIPVEECWVLLATQELGRLGVYVRGYPLVLPVNFALDGRVVVVRTGEGTMHAALGHANVTFEVDDIDRTSRSGWSVLVRGQAEAVGPAHREELVASTRATACCPSTTSSAACFSLSATSTLPPAMRPEDVVRFRPTPRSVSSRSTSLPTSSASERSHGFTSSGQWVASATSLPCSTS